jgi:hypothetical protein
VGVIVWELSCRQSFQRRVLESSVEAETQVCWRQLLATWPENAQSSGVARLIEFVNCAFKVLKDHLDKVDWICRDLWQSGGGSVTADFVRGVVRPEVADQIEKHTSELDRKLKAFMHLKRFENRRPILHHFLNATQQMKQRVSQFYDREAERLKCSSAAVAKPSADSESPDTKSGLVQEVEQSEELNAALANNTTVDVGARGAQTEPSRENLAPRLLQTSPRVSKAVNPEIAKRRALVQANPDASAYDLCIIFDQQGVPLPRKWVEAGLKSWVSAYKNSRYQNRLQVLISKDRYR